MRWPTTLAWLGISLVAARVARADDRPTTSHEVAPRAGWETWRAGDAARSITIEVARDDRKLPLVVFATGSHCLPVFFATPTSEGQRARSMLPFDVEEARKRAPFHFAVLERKGFTSFGVVDDVRATDRCTAEHGGVDKQDRAADLALAARALSREPWVGSIVIAGHSEGADVASGAARLLEPGSFLAVGFLASGGVSQFVDLVLRGRRRGDATVAQRAFDDLLAMTSARPPSDFEGFPRARFDSFAIASTPLDDLASLEVPVFVAQGTADTHSAPESADALVVELLRRSPTRAVRYLVLDGADHAFTDRFGNAHGDDVLVELVTWATSRAPARSVETRSFAKPIGAPSVRFLHVPAGALTSALTAIGAAAIVVRTRRDGMRSRVSLGVASALVLALAGASFGLWRAIASSASEDAQPAFASAGALGGALLATLALWLTSRARPSDRPRP